MSDLSGSTGGIEGWIRKADRRLRSIESAIMKARVPRQVTSTTRPLPSAIQPGVLLFETDTNTVLAVNAAQSDFLALASNVSQFSTEQAQDATAALFAAGKHTGITFTYDDAGNAISAAVTASGGAGYTDEQARDAVAAMFAAGTQTGISFAYDDANDRFSATVTASGSGSGGSTNPSGKNPITGWYHAADNGVTPGNSASTNTTNLQSLLNSIPTSFDSGSSIGATVLFPAGRFHFSGQVTVPKGIRMLGSSGSRVGTEGTGSAVGTAFILDTSGMTLLILNAAADGSNLVQVGPRVEAINFYGPQSGFSGRAIFAPNVNRWTVRDCGFKWVSVAIEGDSTAGQHNGGDCSWWHIENCTFVECGTGIKCTSASGMILSGDMTDCGIGVDIYGTSAPVKCIGAKMDVPGNGIGIRARTYNSMFSNCYFEITDNSAVGMVVGPDPAVSYSGNDNIIMGCGFYGRGSAPNATGVQIQSNANRTRVVAPVLALNAGHTIQDSGSNTIVIGV